MLRLAVALQVVGAGAEQLAHRPERFAGQAFGWVVGDLHQQVETVLDQVRALVADPQLHIDLGVALEKGWHQRPGDELAIGLRHAQAHQPARAAHQPFADGDGGIGRIEHVPAMLVELRPGLVQPQLARRAFQQAQRQGLLQPCYLAAHRRRCAAQQARGAGEAAGLDHPHEHGHIGQKGCAVIRSHAEQVLCCFAGLSTVATGPTISA